MGWFSAAFPICVFAVGALCSLQEGSDCWHQRRVVEDNATSFRVIFPACPDSGYDGIITEALLVNGTERIDVRDLGGGINEMDNYFWVPFTKENMTQTYIFSYHVDCVQIYCWVTGITLEILTTDFHLVFDPSPANSEDHTQDRIELRCKSTLNDSSDIQVDFIFTPSSNPTTKKHDENGPPAKITLPCPKYQNKSKSYHNGTWTVSRASPNSDCLLSILVEGFDQGDYDCRAYLSDMVEYSDERSILMDSVLNIPSPDTPPKGKGDSPVALIVGVSVGGAVLLLIVVVAIVTKVLRPQVPPPVRDDEEEADVRQPLLPDDEEPGAGYQAVDHRHLPQEPPIPNADDEPPASESESSEDEGDARSHEDIVMLRSDGEGNNTQVPTSPLPRPPPLRPPRRTASVEVGASFSLPPSGGDTAQLGTTPGTQITPPTPLEGHGPLNTEPPDLTPPGNDQPSGGGAVGGGGAGSGKSSPSLEPDGLAAEGRPRVASSAPSVASTQGALSEKGPGSSGTPSPNVTGEHPRIPSPSAEGRPRVPSSAPSVASTQGAMSEKGPGSSGTPSPNVTGEHPRIPSPSDELLEPPHPPPPPPVAATGSDSPPLSLGSGRTQGAYSQGSGSSGKTSPASVPLSQESDPEDSRDSTVSTPTNDSSSGPPSSTDLPLFGEPGSSSDDSSAGGGTERGASRRRTISPLTVTQQYRSPAS